MKFEVTQKGVYDKDGKPVPVGTVVELQSDDVPGYLVNKGQVRDKTFVTNPADDGGVQPSAQERQTRLKELTAGLVEADFTKAGEPKLDAVNALLEKGEKEFTSEERDQLWPGIKDS